MQTAQEFEVTFKVLKKIDSDYKKLLDANGGILPV